MPNLAIIGPAVLGPPCSARRFRLGPLLVQRCVWHDLRGGAGGFTAFASRSGWPAQVLGVSGVDQIGALLIDPGKGDGRIARARLALDRYT